MNKNILVCIIFFLIIILMISIFIIRKNNTNIDNMEVTDSIVEPEIMSEYVVYNEISKKLETVYIEKQPFSEDVIDNNEFIDEPEELSGGKIEN